MTSPDPHSRSPRPAHTPDEELLASQAPVITATAPAGSAPRGAGHDYGEEVPAAWVAVLQPEDWTAADTARLTQAVG